MERCWLTNQTGAIIRFRPSQVSKLPNRDVDLNIELPDGRVIPGRFHLNPKNPYVAGKLVRRFIQSRVPERGREQVLISTIGRHWRLFEAKPLGKLAGQYGVSKKRAREGRLTGKDVARILKRIDSINVRKGRVEKYNRLLRPAGLRQLVLELMGPTCQVECCDAAESAAKKWDDPAASHSILEVHHIEALAKAEDHSPRNLSVICANHHRLIHGFGPWKIRHNGDDVILTRGPKSLRIVRNLSVLDKANA